MPLSTEEEEGEGEVDPLDLEGEVDPLDLEGEVDPLDLVGGSLALGDSLGAW